MSADWAQQQAEAKSKKERILGELQSLVRGSSHDYETTNRFKAKSGEFFAAGYAGKADNDRLKARLDELRAAYFAAVEADRRRREAAQDQVKREMQHLLFQMERVVSQDTHSRRWEAWRELSTAFFNAGYPGREAKSELMAHHNKLKAMLPAGIERDRRLKATLNRKKSW